MHLISCLSSPCVGTVVFNSAGGFIPELSLVCLETLNAFQLPVAMNVYLTNPQQRISAPPHTDKQDVFVLQTQGMKRWRVFRPPEPQRQYRADPFARGKATDVLTLSELDSEPLVDTVLMPGQVLYVPAGFPHTTGQFSARSFVKECIDCLIVLRESHRCVVSSCRYVAHSGPFAAFCTSNTGYRYYHMGPKLCLFTCLLFASCWNVG